jgi:PAP2 superfamily C-terminal
VRRLRDSVLVALVWRYACHGAMLLLSLLSEGRPAPALPDAVLSRVPRLPWLDAHNYLIWLACYLPPALLLWRRDRRAFLHFLYLGGFLSLLRGMTVGLTGLGPIDGPDVNAGNIGLHCKAVFAAWLTLINPWTSLFGNAAHVYLTKDLFFSGHVSTTFLLWLYCRGRGRLGTAALCGHAVTVAVVFLCHLHYTIDVVGAWAITYSLYVWAERRWPVRATAA